MRESKLARLRGPTLIVTNGTKNNVALQSVIGCKEEKKKEKKNNSSALFQKYVGF